MNILITGAAGFAASHLIPFLFENETAQIFGTAHSQKNSKIESIPCNLTKPQQVKKLIQSTEPQAVYHLAAQSAVALAWKKPTETFQVNVLGTLHLIQALIEAQKKATLVIVESGEIYDRGEAGTITEETKLKPENPYAASKACLDLMTLPYLNHPDLKIIRMRPFNHIGPGQSTQFVVSSFASQIASIEAGLTEPVLKVGNLKSIRDFTDVRDVVRAYYLACKKGHQGEAYNVSTGSPIEIGEVLKKLLSRTACKIKIQEEASRLRQNDIPCLNKVSSEKLRTHTGWEPKIPLEKSLEDILNFWRQQIKCSKTY